MASEVGETRGWANPLEMGRVLPVHYPLTHEKLASYGFDPNAEFLYALELLPQLGK